jgi:hypothetical protein
MLIGLPVKTWQQVVPCLTNTRAEPASEVVPKAPNIWPRSRKQNQLRRATSLRRDTRRRMKLPRAAATAS